jgi:hypothetical protein
VDAFTENLNKLAELAIKVGLNLEDGQEIVATAPIEAVDFVRLLAEKAYENGASLFTVLYGDKMRACWVPGATFWPWSSSSWPSSWRKRAPSSFSSPVSPSFWEGLGPAPALDETPLGAKT